MAHLFAPGLHQAPLVELDNQSLENAPLSKRGREFEPLNINQVGLVNAYALYPWF